MKFTIDIYRIYTSIWSSQRFTWACADAKVTAGAAVNATLHVRSQVPRQFSSLTIAPFQYRRSASWQAMTDDKLAINELNVQYCLIFIVTFEAVGSHSHQICAQQYTLFVTFRKINKPITVNSLREGRRTNIAAYYNQTVSNDTALAGRLRDQSCKCMWSTNPPL